MRAFTDNLTNVTPDVDNGNFSVTTTLQTSAERRQLPLGVHLTVGLGVSVFGSIANTVVLVVLILARRKYGSSVNIFIINQSAMDFFSCMSVVVIYAVLFSGGLAHGGNQLVGDVLCVIVQGGVFAATGLTAGKLGLTVITVERYFKIVHAIAHRKYYRNWMTIVGVALPWIGAACFTLFPAIGTSRVVNRRCLRLGVWPKQGMAEAYSFVRFVVHYLLPMTIFAYCYGRIFHTIRRQSQVVAGHASRSVAMATNNVSMATTSREEHPDQVQQQQTAAAAAETGNKLSRAELNVLQTMVVVITCFVICYTVGHIDNFLQLFGVSILPHNLAVVFTLLGFINPTVNPIIYAARYAVFRRYLKEKFNPAATVSSTHATSRTVTG